MVTSVDGASAPRLAPAVRCKKLDRPAFGLASIYLALNCGHVIASGHQGEQP